MRRAICGSAATLAAFSVAALLLAGGVATASAAAPVCDSGGAWLADATGPELPEGYSCEVQRENAAAATVLGGKEFAPNGEGWGTERPHTIFNGGDPSGLVTHIRWHNWGEPVAIGWGRNPIFKPHGGYYRHPVRIELRASDVGSCEGRRAYQRLSFREPTRPGGALGPWRSWAGVATVCSAP